MAQAETNATHYAYMLRCADGTIYSGYSINPSRRTALHNSGKGAKYTRSRLPVQLVFAESYPTKSEALKREAALKRLSRAQKIKLIQEADQALLLSLPEANSL